MSDYKTLPRIDRHGVIDMHVHIGPEFLRRRYTSMTLAEEARREGIGVVMKNHFQPTTAMAILARKLADKVAIVGSVTLNYGCGGIDDHGVRSALSGWKSDVTQTDPDRDRFVVWMPTFCAEAHLSVMDRRDIPLHWGVAAKYTREFEEGTGLTLRLQADQVFKAIGQTLLGEGLPELDGRKIKVDGTGRTSLAGVWAGGDCASGGDDLTVTAVAEGRDAAMDIHTTLMGAAG